MSSATYTQVSAQLSKFRDSPPCTSTTMARSFTNIAFAQLVWRLRHTNARYDRIASQLRCCIRPTHHAKRRAHGVGLRIDTSKARACPHKYVSTRTLPVLDTSVGRASQVDGAPATNSVARARHESRTSIEDAYMRCVPLSEPEVVVRRRRRGGRPRVVLRLPPPKPYLNVDYLGADQFEGPVPGAPRLLPRQLPDDEGGMEDMILDSSPSSSTGESDILLTPADTPAHLGFCITIEPRNRKRKLADLEADGDVTYPQQPRRSIKMRRDESLQQLAVF